MKEQIRKHLAEYMRMSEKDKAVNRLMAHATMPEKERVRMLFAATSSHLIMRECGAPNNIEIAAAILPAIMALMDFEAIYNTDPEGLKKALGFNELDL